jgi:hypothetical protein
MFGFVPAADSHCLSFKSNPRASWSGDHFQMIVSATGAPIGYDFAHATIEGQLLAGRDGNFGAIGVHVFERGKPI